MWRRALTRSSRRTRALAKLPRTRQHVRSVPHAVCRQHRARLVRVELVALELVALEVVVRAGDLAWAHQVVTRAWRANAMCNAR